MKITSIEVFLTGATWRNFLFVKLTTDEGLVGWGDGTLEWKESAVRDLILDFGRRYVVGMSPFNIEDLWFRLYQVEHNTGPIMFAAMAGIETAMWDLVGKALGQPVYNLVGGAVRKKLQVYANGWYAFQGDLGKLADRAQEVVSRGYTAMKFDPFGPGVRSVLGDFARLFNHEWYGTGRQDADAAGCSTHGGFGINWTCFSAAGTLLRDRVCS